MSDEKIYVNFEDFAWYSAVPVADDVNGNFFEGLRHEYGLKKTDNDDVEIDYKAAAGFYRKAAEKGDGRSQFRLGVLYSLGLGVERNERLATELFGQAESTVKPCILSVIAEIYFLGRGVSKDEDKARALWEKADGLGCPNAKAFKKKYLGLAYDQQEVDDVAELTALAEGGNVQAQYKLGYYYYEKRGRKNAELALQWLKKAAEEGHPYALYYLSSHIACNSALKCVPYLCCIIDIFSSYFGCVNVLSCIAFNYKRGWGMCYNFEKYDEYIKIAAEAGDPEGKYALAFFYIKGKTYSGAPFELNLVKAVELLKEAADADVDSAKYNFNCYLKQLTPEQKSSLSFADKLPPKKLTAAELKKLCKEGVKYLYGNGVEKDLDTAESYFIKAAEQGYAEAQYYLGALYGEICETSDSDEEFEEYAVLCAEWYEKAAQQGHVLAQFETGKNYLHGEGVEENLEKAKFWLRKAADGGDATAAEILASLN